MSFYTSQLSQTTRRASQQSDSSFWNQNFLHNRRPAMAMLSRKIVLTYGAESKKASYLAWVNEVGTLIRSLLLHCVA